LRSKTVIFVGIEASAAYWARWYAVDDPPAPAPWVCQSPRINKGGEVGKPIMATRFAFVAWLMLRAPTTVSSGEMLRRRTILQEVKAKNTDVLRVSNTETGEAWRFKYYRT
jgi:hypothetical protein